MHSALLFLTLFQMPGASAHAQMANQWHRQIAMRQLEGGDADVKREEAERRDAAYREQQFIEKYNDLVKKLIDFGTAYNEAGVVDVKKVEAVKKAWRDLEKSEPWFAAKSK